MNIRMVVAAMAALAMSFTLGAYGNKDTAAQSNTSPAQSSSMQTTAPVNTVDPADLDSLKDKAVAAGYSCEHWTQSEEDDGWAGSCGTGDKFLMVSEDVALQSALEGIKAQHNISGTDSFIVYGDDWLIRVPTQAQAESLARDMHAQQLIVK